VEQAGAGIQPHSERGQHQQRRKHGEAGKPYVAFSSDVDGEVGYTHREDDGVGDDSADARHEARKQ
jgi:hypothetical protein